MCVLALSLHVVVKPQISAKTSKMTQISHAGRSDQQNAAKFEILHGRAHPKFRLFKNAESHVFPPFRAKPKKLESSFPHAFEKSCP